MIKENKESNQKLGTPKAANFEVVLEQSQGEGQGLGSKHDLTQKSKAYHNGCRLRLFMNVV